MERVLREVHIKRQHNDEFLQAFCFEWQHSNLLTNQQQLMVLQAEVDALKELFNSPGLFRNSKERTEVLAKTEQNSETFRKKL